MRNRVMYGLCLILAGCLLSGCGGRSPVMPGEPPSPTQTTVVMASPTPMPRQTTTPTTAPTSPPASQTSVPIVVNTPAPTQSMVPSVTTPTPAATTAPSPTATPAPVSPLPASAHASPVPAQTPSPAPALPVVTKSPTDETVMEGESCWFIARYENAVWAVWHFVSPDGQNDMTYEAMMKRFPTMEIRGGDISNLELRNIPLEADGWRVYCRYSNDSGYVDTGRATIHVTPNPNAAQIASGGATQTLGVNGFAGSWSDSETGLGTMVIQDLGGGYYQIQVEWRESPESRLDWTMTAGAYELGRLDYTNCKCVRQTFSSDGMYYIATLYENGSGHLAFDVHGRLLWSSDMEDMPENTIFARQ